MPSIYKPQRSRRSIHWPWCPEFSVDTIRCTSDVLVRVEFANSGFYITARHKRKVRQRHFLAFLFLWHIMDGGRPIRREPVGIFLMQFHLGLLPRRIITNGHIVDTSLTQALGFHELPKRTIYIGMNGGYRRTLTFPSHRPH